MSIAQATAVLLPLVDKVPKDNDVVAGWTAFAVFIGLGLAVVVLGVSLTRHLRIAERNLKEPDEPPAQPPTEPPVVDAEESEAPAGRATRPGAP